MTRNWSCAIALAAVVATPARADVWDIQTVNDDAANGRNQLVHGTIQTHDLGVRPGPVADQDWYLMPQKAQASYEVIIDGVSGDIGPAGLRMVRRDSSSDVQIAVAAVTGSTGGVSGYSRALRWVNTVAQTVNELIYVRGADCGVSCGSDDVYTIRVRETTVNLARFNATGGQTTVLLTQNATERPVNATIFYWDGAGTLLQTGTLNLPSKATDVFNVATFPAVAGHSGSITVAHDGGYGGLVIKAVALEPATGFSFDTPGVYVPD